MKTKILFLMIASMLALSCTNDSDFFPSYDDNCNWKTSLDEIIADNQDLFDRHDIEIINFKLMKDLKVSRELFLGDQYGYFPVYLKNDSIFEVIRYDDADKKSGEYGFGTKAVNDKIEKILEKADDYDVIQLTWRYGNDNFKSLSLFNKRTGELEYDNMLFNMSTISKYGGESFAMFLRGAEYGNNVNFELDDSETINYKENYNIQATITMNWYVKGTWVASTSKSEDDEYYYYTTSYYFRVDSSAISYSDWANEGYETVHYESDNTIRLGTRYDFEYAIYAGPKDDFNHNAVYVLHGSSDGEFGRLFSVGNGSFEHVAGPTPKPSDVVAIRKQDSR